MKTIRTWLGLGLLSLLMPTAFGAEIGHEGKGGSLEKLPLPAPTEFTENGKKGWKIAIPGGRPLATPALDDGLIFIGGGFGSTEFYAIEAATGKLAWGFKTGDDGPTAAVVAEGVVAYNTESCTIYVHESKTGKVLWSKWLGDPLMSQPAIANGKIYMAYHGAENSHHLACMELKTGKVIWDQKILGEIISAPVVSGGNVYCACLEGTVFKFNAAEGTKVWAEQRHATSAPYIDGDKVFVSEAKDGSEKQLADAGAGGARGAAMQSVAGLKMETISAFNTDKPSQAMHPNSTPVPAPFLQSENSLTQTKKDNGDKLAAAQADLERLKESKSETSAKSIKELEEKVQAHTTLALQLNQSLQAGQSEFKSEKAQDSSVAFATAPETAKLEQAAKNLGKNSVQGVWAYQGSRPLVRGEKSFVVQGDSYRCVNNADGKVLWDQKLDSAAKATRPVTPPSEAGGKHYLGTVDGEVVCRDMSDGKVLWKVKAGGPIVFQPSIMNGRVVIGTNDGSLICIETGDTAATGWAMWGGNATHDGRPITK